MSWNTGIGTGFNSGLFYPPYNLGPCAEKEYMSECYSNIWGLDPETGEPQRYPVSISVARIGGWAFMSVSGVIKPAHPIRDALESEIPPLGTAGTYYDYNGKTGLMTTAKWDELEITGLPDQIHFTYTLPECLLPAENSSPQEYPIPIEVIYNVYEDEEDPAANSSGSHVVSRTKTEMGNLVISDTGVMEIRGNFTHWGWLMKKDAQGNITYADKHGMTLINDLCIDCGTCDIENTKADKVKGDPTTGYLIGFKSFNLLMNVGDETFYDMIQNHKKTEDDIPTVNDPCSYVLEDGRDLNYEKITRKDLINRDETAKKRATIAWFKSLLKRYKSYYESLTLAERSSIQATLYAALQNEAKKFIEFDNYFKISDYIPEPTASTSSGDGNDDNDTVMS